MSYIRAETGAINRLHFLVLVILTICIWNEFLMPKINMAETNVGDELVIV